MFPVKLLLPLLLAGFAAAQSQSGNGTGIHAVPSGLGTVDATTRSQWCNSQQSACILLCGGKQYTEFDSCEASTLNWNCTCANGKEPADLQKYTGTLPELECQQVFKVCQQANPGGCSAADCGTLDPKSVKSGAGAKSSSSSAAASSTATPSSTGTAAAAKPSGSSAAGKFKPEMGFAAGIVAAMGALL